MELKLQYCSENRWWVDVVKIRFALAQNPDLKAKRHRTSRRYFVASCPRASIWLQNHLAACSSSQNNLEALKFHLPDVIVSENGFALHDTSPQCTYPKTLPFLDVGSDEWPSSNPFKDCKDGS
jgi:hypothetical protein